MKTNLALILGILNSQGITQCTFQAGIFDEEYQLPCDDKDFVTFFKGNNTPWICDKLKVCDYFVSLNPV